MDEPHLSGDNQRMRERIIPALRFDALTRFFDPVVRVTTRERTCKKRLVAQVAPRPGDTVVDIGCGTATLAIALKRACSGADVHGVDADPNVLALAQRKVDAAGVQVRLHEALAWELPFGDGTVHRAVSSLMFHHLHRDAKLDALASLHRVLAPDGELHIADWGRPHDLAMRAAFLGVQLLDGFGTTSDSVTGKLVELMCTVGFRDVEETQRIRTPLGTLALYRARR